MAESLFHASADPNTAVAAPHRALGAPARSRWPFAHYLAAVSCGALNTLSFAPVKDGGWLELAVLAAACWLLTRCQSTKAAALTGGAFGFGNFVCGIWWLYISMHDYGGMMAPLAIGALLLFSLYLALYPALAGALWRLCISHAHGWHSSFVFASAWALSEWLRGIVFTGFPWLASGYAQVDGPLAGYAPVVGVYGVGWLAACVAALLAQGACAAAVARPSRSLRRARSAALPIGLALALIGSGLALSMAEWTRPAYAPLRARLLQGNVAQSMKFSEAGFLQSVARYQRLITAQPADLVVAPETALPTLIQQLPADFARAVRTFADSTGTAVLFGAVGAQIVAGKVTDFANSLYGVTPGSGAIYRYDKHHLVPFGEFIPLGFHWFVTELMHIPLGDLKAGPANQSAFVVRGQPIALSICSEDIYGEEIASTLRAQRPPATILINSANFGWYGDTIALDQNLQIAQMRALETGRPVLLSTNTGITAAIDAKGRVTGRLRPFTVGALDTMVQGHKGITPYLAAGNLPVVTLSFTILLAAASFRRVRRKRDRSDQIEITSSMAARQ